MRSKEEILFHKALLILRYAHSSISALNFSANSRESKENILFALDEIMDDLEILELEK